MVAKIQIRQVAAQIGVETQRASLRVVRSAMKRLQIRQQMAQMQIESKISRVRIDQTQVFAESGLKSPLVLARAFYQNSAMMGIEAISTIAAEGARFLQIHNKANPFAEIARTRGVHQRQMTAVAMPQSRPDISWDPGYVHIEWTRGGVEVSWEDVPAEVEYQPHSVRVFVRRPSSIEITVDDQTGEFVPEHRREVGRNLDHKL